MTEMTNSLSKFIKENILENVLSKPAKKTRKTKAADDFKIVTSDEYYKNHIQLKSYIVNISNGVERIEKELMMD